MLNPVGNENGAAVKERLHRFRVLSHHFPPVLNDLPVLITRSDFFPRYTWGAVWCLASSPGRSSQQRSAHLPNEPILSGDPEIQNEANLPITRHTAASPGLVLSFRKYQINSKAHYFIEHF